jgi:hypothetical protein
MQKFIAGNTTTHACQAAPSRRQFLLGALAAGAVGLTACGEGQSVQIASHATPTPSATPPPNPLPSLPPLEPKTYPADAANALRAMDEMIAHYAKVFDTPSALIHAVRAFGRNFLRADGSNAVEHLCSRYAEEKTVNGKRLIRFTRFNVEVHDNSFLKTFLEASVSPTQAITVGSNKYTVQELGEHAKALFRVDPNNFNRYEKDFTFEHLPWGLIAFSNLLPGGKGRWDNAYSEKVDLLEVLDKALLEFETACQPLRAAQEKNESIPGDVHKAMQQYSCFGGHSLYSFVACLKNGYTERRMPERVAELMNVSLYRLAKECENIEQDYAEAANRPISPNPQEEAMYQQQLQRAGVTKQQVVEMLSLRGQLKLTGHILEAVNFARLHKLFQPTPEQQKYLQAGEQKLFASIVKLRALNWEALKNFNAKQVNDNVVALGHASRALKLLTPENPDKSPKTI